MNASPAYLTAWVRSPKYHRPSASPAMPLFQRYLGIDYSGAQTPTSSLPGLRVYAAEAGIAPQEIGPPPSPRKYWTRRGLAEWLVTELRAGPTTLVGIDHAFSFPLRYFEAHGLAPDWPAFLDDFQRHWPTDDDNTYVDFIRDRRRVEDTDRTGHSRWRRLAEVRCRAKSVFQFDGQGSVAKSTHAGLPWLRHLRQELGAAVHFWPFDGWAPPAGRSGIAEVSPALWTPDYPDEGRNSHQHAAYSAARRLQEVDAAGNLTGWFAPSLLPAEKTVAQLEGWILGLG
jgi:hypothetical protein